MYVMRIEYIRYFVLFFLFCRGGVFEFVGIVEIKFWCKDFVKVMYRLDVKC